MELMIVEVKNAFGMWETRLFEDIKKGDTFRLKYPDTLELYEYFGLTTFVATTNPEYDEFGILGVKTDIDDWSMSFEDVKIIVE